MSSMALPPIEPGQNQDGREVTPFEGEAINRAAFKNPCSEQGEEALRAFLSSVGRHQEFEAISLVAPDIIYEGLPPDQKPLEAIFQEPSEAQKLGSDPYYYVKDFYEEPAALEVFNLTLKEGEFAIRFELGSGVNHNALDSVTVFAHFSYESEEVVIKNAIIEEGTVDTFWGRL